MTAPTTTTPLLDRIAARRPSVNEVCPQCGRDLRLEPHTPAATSQECWRKLLGYPGRPRWLSRLQPKDMTGAVSL